MARFQAKCEYAQTEDDANKKLYKRLINTEESKPKNMDVLATKGM